MYLRMVLRSWPVRREIAETLSPCRARSRIMTSSPRVTTGCSRDAGWHHRAWPAPPGPGGSPPRPGSGAGLGNFQPALLGSIHSAATPALQSGDLRFQWIPLYMVSARGMDIKQFALFAWLPFLGADLGCILGGYLSPFLSNRFGMSLVNSRIAGTGVGAVCMIGPGLIGLVSSPIAAILLFSVGAFAHQKLSSLLYALVTDSFEKQNVATATGFGGMAGYLGGTLFSLLIGQLASTIGYEPLFACLSVFDILAFLVVLVVLGERGTRVGGAVPSAAR